MLRPYDRPSNRSTVLYRPLPPSTAFYRLLPPSTAFYRLLSPSTALSSPPPLPPRTDSAPHPVRARAAAAAAGRLPAARSRCRETDSGLASPRSQGRLYA